MVAARRAKETEEQRKLQRVGNRRMTAARRVIETRRRIQTKAKQTTTVSEARETEGRSQTRGKERNSQRMAAARTTQNQQGAHEQHMAFEYDPTTQWQPIENAVSVSLTKNHSSCTLQSKTFVTLNDSMSLDAERAALQPHRLSGKTKRPDLVISSMCVLCRQHVPTSPVERRSHLISVHGAQLGASPNFHCLHCGQLFWISEEFSCHQLVSCESCLSLNICKSTYYLHWVLRHQPKLFKLLQDWPLSCKLCSFKCTSIQIFTIHLREQHYSVIPLDLLRKFGQLHFTPVELDSCPFVPYTELISVYTMTVRKRQSLSYALVFPPPIVSYDPEKPSRQIFTCSVCNAQFISVTYCDLHMVQAGHQYFCPFCPYSSDRAATLRAHHITVHARGRQDSSEPSGNEFELSEVDPAGKNIDSEALVPFPDSNISASFPSSSHPSDAASILHTVATRSQFHACDKCPVFCLTMEDLDAHRQTAHPRTPTTTSANLSPNSPPVAVSHHPQKIEEISDGKSKSVQLNDRLDDATPCRSVAGASPVVGRTLVDAASSKEVITPQSPKDQVISSSVRIKAEPGEDEFICDLCEFRSSIRSEIMQHVVGAHQTNSSE
ncbi:unnamed protein product [Calicophoron daubneyi]|uniref:C2H2-type domain-containing protein n=1 Tax=Calicophoron daubneyi TaxID=300641 RepID=A0AAV2TTC3_CALDB